MFNHGHPHSELLLKIETVGEVPCERLPQVFFPEDLPDPEIRAKAISTAQELCGTCPIRQACLDYAIDTGQEWGIWGGVTIRDHVSRHPEEPSPNP